MEVTPRERLRHGIRSANVGCFVLGIVVGPCVLLVHISEGNPFALLYWAGGVSLAWALAVGAGFLMAPSDLAEGYTNELVFGDPILAIVDAWDAEEPAPESPPQKLPEPEPEPEPEPVGPTPSIGGRLEVTIQPEQTCPYCLDLVAGRTPKAIVGCAACKAVLHRECLLEFRSCPTAGCRNQRRRRRA